MCIMWFGFPANKSFFSYFAQNNSNKQLIKVNKVIKSFNFVYK